MSSYNILFYFFNLLWLCWGFGVMGHLEHACMNADSTRTRLVLQHGSPWMLDNDGGDHLTERWIHKLVTSCLASNQQYEKSIPSLLKRWTECLCLERGRMVLLVKHSALKCIEDALTDTPWSISYGHCLSDTTIMVVIEPITRQVSGTTRIEVKPKEEWVNWRLQTLPWMVPTDRPRWSNQILMARGKVRKRSLPGRWIWIHVVNGFQAVRWRNLNSSKALPSFRSHSSPKLFQTCLPLSLEVHICDALVSWDNSTGFLSCR